MREIDSTCFPPHIQKQVDFLLRKQQLCLGRDRVRVLNPAPSSPSFEKNGNCDRFHISVPFAGSKFEFCVLMQASDPECPPDFVFADPKFFVPYEEMMSLLYWDINQCDSLWKVVKELVSLYRKKNIEDLEMYSDLNYEYLTLFQLRNFTEEDIEIHVPYKSKAPITMLLRLNVEFCDILPDVIYKPGVQSSLLFLSFPDRDNEKFLPRLYLSGDLCEALDLDKKFLIKNLRKDFQLDRYLLAIEDKLRCQVDLIAGRYESRKAYFAKFLSHYQGCVIEYDITYFFTMALLIEVEDFSSLVEITLPDKYPEEIPVLVFRSIYHKQADKPKSVVSESYPYSPTWSLDKVLSETARFILTYLEMLKEDQF